MSDRVINELVWLSTEGFELESLNDYGWLLATNGQKMAPAFVGYSLFRKKPKWCNAITRQPLDWQPTHIAYPVFDPAVAPV